MWCQGTSDVKVTFSSTWLCSLYWWLLVVCLRLMVRTLHLLGWKRMSAESQLLRYGLPSAHLKLSYGQCAFFCQAPLLWDNYYYYWSLLYSAILRSRADSLRSHAILHEWMAFYSAFFEYLPKWCTYNLPYLLGHSFFAWHHLNLPSRWTPKSVLYGLSVFVCWKWWKTH